MVKRILIAVLLMVFAGYGAQAQTPLQYNNKLVNITDSLHAKGGRWVQVFKQVKVIKDFSILTPYRADLEKYINTKIAELKSDKDVGGSGELRQAVIEFLEYEKNFVQNYFIPIEKMSATTTDEELKAAINGFTLESQKEDPILNKVDAAQNEYAKKNNIKMEEPKTK